MLEDAALEILPPTQVIDYDDFVDQVRDEVNRHFDSGTNRQFIIDLFHEEIDKEYFARRIAAITRRERKIISGNQADKVLWLAIGGALAAIATRLI